MILLKEGHQKAPVSKLEFKQLCHTTPQNLIHVVVSLFPNAMLCPHNGYINIKKNDDKYGESFRPVHETALFAGFVYDQTPRN